MSLHVLGHIKPYHRVSAAEVLLGEHLGQLGLTDSCGQSECLI
jgi:hypothetical protein